MALRGQVSASSFGARLAFHIHRLPRSPAPPRRPLPLVVSNFVPLSLFLAVCFETRRKLRPEGLNFGRECNITRFLFVYYVTMEIESYF